MEYLDKFILGVSVEYHVLYLNILAYSDVAFQINT